MQYTDVGVQLSTLDTLHAKTSTGTSFLPRILQQPENFCQRGQNSDLFIQSHRTPQQTFLQHLRSHWVCCPAPSYYCCPRVNLQISCRHSQHYTCLAATCEWIIFTAMQRDNTGSYKSSKYRLQPHLNRYNLVISYVWFTLVLRRRFQTYRITKHSGTT